MPAEYERIRKGIMKSNPDMSERQTYAISVAVYEKRYGKNPFTGKEVKNPKYKKKETKRKDIKDYRHDKPVDFILARNYHHEDAGI